jgi:hypothetical protein
MSIEDEGQQERTRKRAQEKMTYSVSSHLLADTPPFPELDVAAEDAYDERRCAGESSGLAGQPIDSDGNPTSSTTIRERGSEAKWFGLSVRLWEGKRQRVRKHTERRGSEDRIGRQPVQG